MVYPVIFWQCRLDICLALSTYLAFNGSDVVAALQPDPSVPAHEKR